MQAARVTASIRRTGAVLRKQAVGRNLINTEPILETLPLADSWE
jgi:hypothetical protein